jgi:hypothetical protein
MALLNRKDLQQRHAEFDLPPLSLSTIQRLEKRGLLNPIKLNPTKPSGPEYRVGNRHQSICW